MITCCRRTVRYEAPQDAWTNAVPDMEVIWETVMLSRAVYFWTGAETALRDPCDWEEMKQIAAAPGPDDERLVCACNTKGLLSTCGYR